MSVGTLVTYRRAERKTQYIPLATEEEFHRLWLPLAQGLHLQWIPLFASGVLLTTSDFPAVLEELAQMWEAITTGMPSSDAKAKALDRAALVIALLESLDPANVEEVFIG